MVPFGGNSVTACKEIHQPTVALQYSNTAVYCTAVYCTAVYCTAVEGGSLRTLYNKVVTYALHIQLRIV